MSLRSSSGSMGSLVSSTSWNRARATSPSFLRDLAESLNLPAVGGSSSGILSSYELMLGFSSTSSGMVAQMDELFFGQNHNVASIVDMIRAKLRTMEAEISGTYQRRPGA